MDFFTISHICYFFGSILFIIGLKQLSSPTTAERGNKLSGVGMSMAIIGSLIQPIDGNYGNMPIVLGSMVIGATIGYTLSKRVIMTEMPQLVAIFNGFGGLSAVILAVIEFYGMKSQGVVDFPSLSITIFTIFVGAVTFSGSILAYLKLDGKVKDKNVILPGHKYINMGLLLFCVVVLFYMNSNPTITVILIATIICFIYGFSFVAPIGGADMPVVISLLNSFSGISAASAGLIYGNQIMILGGILVGASGIILTAMMCEAMNRSLTNVLIGGFGTSSAIATISANGESKTAKTVTPNDTAIRLIYSNKILVVPGYGMAVSQAQKIAKEIDEYLTNKGVEVIYGIHPVAGRMPGHMNVLLAEVDIDYDKLLDLEQTNSQIADVDVVLVIGANDVVNPSALNDPSSNIYGMPVLEVWKAKNVIIFKRSMNAGYAGIENPLFFLDNSAMLFGDAKKSLKEILDEIKTVG